MKTVILISSIFYILGLKIGDKIDIVKKEQHPLQKELIQKSNQTKDHSKCDQTMVMGTKCISDSVSKGISYTDALLKPLEF